MRVLSGIGNSFGDCTFMLCGGHGIYLGSGANFTIINGCIANSNAYTVGTSSGFYVDSNTANFSIVGCTASNIGPEGGGSQDYGIYISGGCVNYSVAGNNVLGNAIAGISNNSSPSNNGIVHSNATNNSSNLPTGSVLNDVTGSRSIGSTYTNSKLSPLYVSVSLAGGSGSSVGGWLYVNNGYGYVQVAGNGFPAGTGTTVAGFVPPGQPYYVSTFGSGVVLAAWTEC